MAESVSFRGQIIIPIGAPVVGEVARFQRNGHVEKKVALLPAMPDTSGRQAGVLGAGNA